LPDTLTPFVHPETGQVLETKDEFLDALNEIDLRMSPMWVVRRTLREAYADRFEPTLPSPVYRTVTQEKVARCPRCGSRLEA
jgi:hypothetical protein